MTKQQFIRRCIKQLNLLVVNHFNGDVELMDRTGKSDYHNYIHDSGIVSWDTRYQEAKTSIEFARKSQSNW